MKGKKTAALLLTLSLFAGLAGCGMNIAPTEAAVIRNVSSSGLSFIMFFIGTKMNLRQQNRAMEFPYVNGLFGKQLSPTSRFTFYIDFHICNIT